MLRTPYSVLRAPYSVLCVPPHPASGTRGGNQQLSSGTHRRLETRGLNRRRARSERLDLDVVEIDLAQSHEGQRHMNAARGRYATINRVLLPVLRRSIQ